MTDPTRLLFVEDSTFDVELIVRQLSKDGFEVEFSRVETPEQMKVALTGQKWDGIIADFRLPGFDAPAALSLLQSTGQDLPFIVVSGAIGEEAAVALMKAGAHDYLMKSSLLRLAPVLKREIAEAKKRHEHLFMQEELRIHQIELEMQNEELLAAHQELDDSRTRYFELYNLAPVGYCTISDAGLILEANLMASTMLAKNREDLVHHRISLFIHKEDQDVFYHHRKMLLETTLPQSFELRMENGSMFHLWVRMIVSQALGSEGDCVIRLVFIDVTERKRAEAMREALMAELTAKNEELDRFTYTVSHDLKSPLHTIQGFAQEIKESLAENDLKNIDEFLERIQNGARHMGMMLEDLIKLARLGQEANVFESISLNTILQEVKDVLIGIIATNKVVLVIEDNLPTIQGCPTRLHELFQNLIENSIKFRSTEVVSRIEVGCMETASQWKVFVKDNGIGIALAQQSRIFGLFHKLNPKSEGSGIGLALVSRIAQMHHAQIRLESQGEGRGCTFWVHFPKERQDG
jgi:PAS domain S-box-containing protein